MRLLAHIPERWRLRLDNIWLWVFLYGLAISGTLVALFFVNARAVHALSRPAEENYRACIRSIPLLRTFRTHVIGVEDGFQTLVDNSAQALAATPRTDPTYRVRVANLARLAAASHKVSALTDFPVPSEESCADTRARQLGNG